MKMHQNMHFTWCILSIYALLGNIVLSHAMQPCELYKASKYILCFTILIVFIFLFSIFLFSIERKKNAGNYLIRDVYNFAFLNTLNGFTQGVSLWILLIFFIFSINAFGFYFSIISAIASFSYLSIFIITILLDKFIFTGNKKV